MPQAGSKFWSCICVALALLLLLAVPGVPAAAEEDAATEIRAALTQWTEDFNAGRTDKVCDLFAKDAARRCGRRG